MGQLPTHVVIGCVDNDAFTLACGHFCVYYLIYRSRDIPMNDITTELNHIEHNDKYVMDFVNALL